jgi:hypothetical protein
VSARKHHPVLSPSVTVQLGGKTLGLRDATAGRTTVSLAHYSRRRAGQKAAASFSGAAPRVGDLRDRCRPARWESEVRPGECTEDFPAARLSMSRLGRRCTVASKSLLLEGWLRGLGAQRADVGSWSPAGEKQTVLPPKGFSQLFSFSPTPSSILYQSSFL